MYNTIALSILTVLCGHHHYAFLELFRLSSQKFGSHETITPHSSLSSAPGNHYPTLCFYKIAYFKIPKILYGNICPFVSGLFHLASCL